MFDCLNKTKINHVCKSRKFNSKLTAWSESKLSYFRHGISISKWTSVCPNLYEKIRNKSYSSFMCQDCQPGKVTRSLCSPMSLLIPTNKKLSYPCVI